MVPIASVPLDVDALVAEYIADGAKALPIDEYRARLEACDLCPGRNGNLCGGCQRAIPIGLRARGGWWECPHQPESNWPRPTGP